MDDIELNNLFDEFKNSVEGKHPPKEKYFMDMMADLCRSSYDEGFKAGIEEFKKSVSDY